MKSFGLFLLVVVCGASKSVDQLDIHRHPGMALHVPRGCQFGHVDGECYDFDHWNKTATEQCKTRKVNDDSMHTRSFSMLYQRRIPCEEDLYSGVQFVCCPIGIRNPMVAQFTTEGPLSDPIDVCTKDSNGYPCECDAMKGTIDCSDESLHTTHLRPIYDYGGQRWDVKHVIMKNNHLTELFKEDIIPGHANTTEILDVSHNLIVFIEPGAFRNMKSLQELDLSSNRIHHLSKEVFEEDLAWNLEELDLSDNRLANLSGPVFENLSDLRFLYLDNNPLRYVDDETFRGLKNLRELTLDNTNLHHVGHKWFTPLYNLETMSMRQNRFLVVPELNGLGKLKSIDISGNPITELNSNVFTAVPNLQQLTLTHMPYLWAIEDCAFCGLPKLNELRAYDNNKLYVVDEEAFGKNPCFDQPMDVVDFENCALSTLSGKLPWNKINSIKLANNPWNCDCKLKWIRNPNIQLKIQDPPICTKPPRLANHTITLLYESELQCANRKVYRVGRVLFIIMMIVLTCSAVFLLWYMWLGRGTNALKLRSLIRRPPLPRYAYRNLAMAASDSAEDIIVDREKPPEPVQV